MAIEKKSLTGKRARVKKAVLASNANPAKRHSTKFTGLARTTKMNPPPVHHGG